VLGTDGLELQYSAEVHSDWILSVTFCVGGKRLLSCGRDRTIRALAAGDGKLLKTLATFDGAVTRVVERPGFAQVLAAGEKMEPRIYDVEGLREIRKLEMQPGPIFAAAFSADGKRLALAGSAGELRTYEADTGKRLSSLFSGPGWIYSLAFDASGKRLAAGGYEGTVRMWDIESGRKTAEIIPVPLEGAEK
jgi:WD40 repeat protein